ncbi:hypothetical protein ACTFIU_000006 [Dictyostelium citrinum]
MERMDLEDQQKLHEFEKAALKGIAYDNFTIYSFHRDELIEYVLMIPQIPKTTWEEIKAPWTGQVMFTVYVPTIQYAWTFYREKIDLETMQAMENGVSMKPEMTFH